MASSRTRIRTVVQWLLLLAVVAFMISDWGDDDEHLVAQPSDEAGGAQAFQITAIADADVNPGDALVVRYEGADPARPVEATLARRAAEILVHGASSVVVRIAPGTPSGRVGLRLVQGDHRTKAWDLQVRPNKPRKLVTRLLGGLALFIYGLGVLAKGLRGLAGSRVRALLGRWTRSSTQALGVGVLVGGVTQLTTSAAAFAVGLVDARLLAVGPTIAIFVGAQLGAALTGALLPVALAGESLLVITLGVAWRRLATGRRGAAAARLMVGAGLTLYGLHLLQTAVQPLVSDPKILPYVAYLRDSGAGSLGVCALAGALVALVLQGPGPVYILVLALTQTSGVIPLANALAILAGTNLGAAVGMALIAWQSGRYTRALAAPHVAFGAFATALALATIPLWTAMFPSVTALDHTRRVIHPDLARYLGLGFALTQLAAGGLWLAVLPRLTRRVLRRPVVAPPIVAPDVLALGVRLELAAALRAHTLALDGALEMSCTSDRAVEGSTEGALLEARRTLERQYGLVTDGGSPGLERTTQTLVSVLQLQRQVEQLVNVAALGIERGLRLSPEDQVPLRKLHELAIESYTAAIAAVEQGAPLDLEAAGGREIQMNLHEAAARRSPLIVKRSESASFGVGLADLVDTYEHVGNHLFRVCKTLSAEVEEL